MLTTEQKLLIKAYVLADPVLSTKVSGAGTDLVFVLNALNAKTSTTAWRVAVPPVESDDAPSYAAFDSLSAGKRDSWALFLLFARDFSRAKVRTWITDVWGNATGGSNAEAILQAGTEKATQTEVVIGGNTRTTGTVSALNRDWIGVVNMDELRSLIYE